MGWKPDRHSAVSPYLVVADPAATLDFAIRVLGGTELLRHTRPDGSIAHAEVQIDDSVVMVGGAMPGWPAQPSNVHVYVPDVDTVYAAALDYGAESVQAPAQKDDPDRRGGIRDQGGTIWWIATHHG